MSGNRSKQRHVILCCDCEGTRRQLERIIRVVEGTSIPANFFFVGETALAFPDLVRLVSTHHQVESHTYSHPNLRRLDRESQRAEILGGKHAVEDTIQRPTRGFRAPMHCMNRDTIGILQEEGFVFDASRLYFRYDMGSVQELHPTWFREWMPLYESLRVRPRTAFGLFTLFTRLFWLSVLPIHPHYAGKSDELAEAFHRFVLDAQQRGVQFWFIDRFLERFRGVAPPLWLPPEAGQPPRPETGTLRLTA